MAVSVEMQHTGDSGLQAEVRAIIEHTLADRVAPMEVTASAGTDLSRAISNEMLPGFQRDLRVEFCNYARCIVGCSRKGLETPSVDF